jgi:hypothetical protein
MSIRQGVRERILSHSLFLPYDKISYVEFSELISQGMEYHFSFSLRFKLFFKESHEMLFYENYKEQ